ncbi:MAG: type II toxin-antitoxin system Phd/YefM family antitoxin [Rickettsia endosymbiont of Culicoides impunctatus]|uniref:type II toxin-antitoxin system Phd/YefM family antitoxin n=1 Tax=unclassified Candidatus Tisiphia TaxID=2996318 RepID=UPI001E7FEE54|nr:type II toxin-antitoxin system Phd/YefM family antitoxin [Rickettsia endosymbiont of Platyusa sonomae]UCM85734.1 MAG: type II toxin-antitoxin system Phd/YefM family antitoxin [Rickettsia endosymbiont of Culicoides impunctatus]
MFIYSATIARSKLFKLIDEIHKTHEPIYIKGKRNNAVILSEEDYASMQETLYLLSIPNMRESILQASREPIEECKDYTEVEW